MCSRGTIHEDEPDRRHSPSKLEAMLNGHSLWSGFLIFMLLIWFTALGNASTQVNWLGPSSTMETPTDQSSSSVESRLAPGKAVVTLKSPAIVTGNDILLGNIADIQTIDQNLLARLAALVVGRAAIVGQERILSVGSVRVRFRQAGISEDSVSIVAPSDNIVVRTAASAVPAAEIVRFAESAVASAMMGQVGSRAPTARNPSTVLAINGANASVSCPALPKDLPVPGLQYQIGLTDTVSFSALSNQVTVPVGVWSEGQLQQQVTARCLVVANGEVAVLARKMDLRETLGPNDIRWEKRNLASAPGGVVLRSADFSPAAWRMLRPQEPGVILTWDMIEAQPNAKAESEVEILTRIGAVQVTDLGCLLRDARIGERVSVRNVRTGAVVEGVLKTPRQVLVTP